MQKKRIRNVYEFVDKPAGEGSYGIVYKGRDIRKNCNVALKKIRMDDENEGIPPTALREIALLKEVVHPNLVKLIGVEKQSSRYFLVFEWVDRDLKKHLEEVQKLGGLRTDQIRSYIYQVLLGLEHCHSHLVFHRDLKPQNILVDSEGNIKIADFGLARAFSIPLRNYTHEVVTLWYRAPEILLGMKKYSLPIDVWSVGCVLAELCDGIALWQGDCEIDQLFRIFQYLGTPNESSWNGVSSLPDYKNVFPKWPARPIRKFVTRNDRLTKKGLNLLEKLFVYDPANRITVRDALEHDYFDEIRRGGSRDSPIVLE